LHYEVELALIMGKEVKDLDAADEKGALEAIESTSMSSAPVLADGHACGHSIYQNLTPILSSFLLQATQSAST
jgi:hypothetical protein